MNITVTDSTSDIVVETVENSTAVTIQQSVVEITSSPGTNDHAHLSNLDYANSGHTGFEASGAASSAIASHVGQADPHTQYALESALPTRLFGGAFTDTVVPGTGDDSKFGRWNNTLQRLEWASVSVAPGGSSGQVQYHGGSGFAGHSGFVYDGAGKAMLSAALVVPAIRPAIDNTSAFNVQNAAGTKNIVSIDSVLGNVAIQRITAGATTFRVLDVDGTELYKETPDTSNYHMYYRRQANFNFISPAMGMTVNGVLYVNGSLYPNGDVSLGAFAYATAGTPLSRSRVLRFVTWAWNGSNGYTITSMFDLNARQKSAVAGDSDLVLWAYLTGDIVTIKANGNIGLGVENPNNRLDVAGTVAANGIRINAIPTNETISPTHTFVISLNGTNYKIPCVAA